MPNANASAIPILEPPSHHRRLVEQHVHSLLQRHSYDLDARDSDGGALSLDDLTVVHGVDRFSVPALVSLAPDLPFGGSSRVSSVGLNATAASSSRSSLGASGGFSSPDHELANTRVRFVGVTRHRGAGHCEFLVQVDTGKEQFVVRKRYSEFRDLRQQLLAALKAGQHCRGGACAQLAQIEGVKFPRRKLRIGLKRSISGGGGGDLDTARDRVVLLQRFVEAVLRVYRMAPKRQVRCCLNAQCKMLGDVRGFLDLAMPEGGALSLGDSVGLPADVDAVVPSAATTSSRDLEWRERAKSTGSSVTVVSPSSAGDCMRASLGCARGKADDVADAKEAAASRRSLPTSTRTSLMRQSNEQLYTITEDLEALHVHA